MQRASSPVETLNVSVKRSTTQVIGEKETRLDGRFLFRVRRFDNRGPETEQILIQLRELPLSAALDSTVERSRLFVAISRAAAQKQNRRLGFLAHSAPQTQRPIKTPSMLREVAVGWFVRRPRHAPRSGRLPGPAGPLPRARPG